MKELKEYLNKGNVVQELDEKSVLDLVDAANTLVVKVWMENCGFCKQYAPIFQKIAENNQDPNVSFISFKLPAGDLSTNEFAKRYMFVDGKLRAAAPATMLFSNKTLASKHYGTLSEDALKHYLLTGDPNLDKRLELEQLFTKKGAIITASEKLPQINKRIEELEKLLQPQN